MKKRIAIQGIKGSFHHEAASYAFNEPLELNECVTFQEVVDHTVAGSVDYGIMAIENSLAGCIIPNYNLLRHSGLEVCGEVGIRVHLHLLGLNGDDPTSLVEVHSHQMALRQCNGFLQEHPKLRIVETFDTAGSARLLAEEKPKGVGAIASKLAAEEYGLKILAQGIEDHQLNYTRFLILKRKDQRALTDHINKLSIYFQTKHSPGALAQLLSVISGIGINVAQLQSHPVPSKNTLYGFFASLEIEQQEQIQHLEILLDAMTIEYQLLGAYEKGETHG